MNWDAIGALAELLAAIGVIGSLIYLGSQVKASTSASEVEAKLKTTEFLVNFQDLLLNNPVLQSVMLRGRKSLDALDKEESLQFSFLVQKAFWYFSACFFQKRKKTIDDEDWFEVKAIIDYWTTSRGAYEWWQKFGQKAFTGEFAAYIEAEFERNQVTTGAD